ncbi:MAG TPA: radical SAM protein [Thermopetrobacter sp.]|nr:radical SAM protein [Thermopetrobacter sp.]
MVRKRIKAPAPFLVALNLTQRCNLACRHCYLDAGTKEDGGADELTTGEVTKLIDEIADLSDETMVVLTGGEPLLRPDIMAIAGHASGRGLMTVMGTNGMGLTRKRAEALLAAGVRAVGISVDSLRPAYHDGFRGLAGAWEKTMAGLDACRAAGLMFQVHFSVTDDNAHELDDMISFCREAGAAVLNVFFMVCTGRGERYSGISPATYDRVLRQVAEAARDEHSLMVRARCAPHFKRIAMEMTPPLNITLADGYEAGGCIAASRYARVTPEGEVTPCPYMEKSAGSLRQQSFARIWREAPLLNELRAPQLEGRCGACEFSRLCGGCRARPLARDGNMMGEDFLCRYEPGGGGVIEPMPVGGAVLPWTGEARERLQRVPAFVRRFVRRRAEDHVRATGGRQVTAAVLDELARRRFGRALPGRPRRPGSGMESG